MQEGNEDGPKPKKKRGQYKLWLLDPTVPIPPATIHSRMLAASRSSDLEQPAGSDQNAELEANNEENVAENDDSEPDVHEPATPSPLHGSEADEPESPAQMVAADQEVNEPVPQVEVNATSKQSDDFIKKHRLMDKLEPRSKLSKLEVLVAILHLAVRHCHTQHFIEDQIEFVNFIFGVNVLDVSYYIFKTLFTPCVTITKHFFCVDCELYLGKDQDFVKVVCSECHTEGALDSSRDFVVCSDCCLCVSSVEDFDTNQSIQCPKCAKNLDVSCKVPEGSAVCGNCKFFMAKKKKYVKKVKQCQCPKCNKEIDVHSVTSGNYFVTFSLREQIEEFLAKPGLRFISRTNRDPNVIADICDGVVYRKLMEPGGPLEDENALTMTFNTDGVEVFENPQNSLYPIWYHINEVVPEQRFKQENLLLAGLWFSKSAPNMALFMKPFTDQLIDLSSNGVSRSLPNGASVKSPVFPLMCSVDSVCKPKIMCQKQFNGKMGCLYCYHPNDTTSEVLKNKQTFYCQESVYRTRTDEEVIRDMIEADNLSQKGLLKNKSVNGFMGISVLLKFSVLLQFLSCNTFGFVWGVAIDYMHAALEGVTADLFNIIGNVLSAEQLKILDERIQMITPPQGMTRRPRSFSDRGSWKAKEYRAVLLYYILPCLEGLLADKYYNNLKLFVNALSILLSDCITHVKLLEAAACLDKFCVGYQRLYGIVNVSYNLHICRHFPELVKRYGALWCYSNFVFESGNGYILRFVKGTKSVVNEIATKYTAIQTATKLMVGRVSDNTTGFCAKILKPRIHKDGENVESDPLLTSFSVGLVSNEEANVLLENNIIVSESTVKYVNRLVRNGILYCSKSYSKANVHNDSCVMLNDGTFAIIDKIVQSRSEQLLCIIQPIRIARGKEIIPSILRCSHDVFKPLQIIPFSDVKRKCVFINFNEKNFVCMVPNFYERD